MSKTREKPKKLIYDRTGESVFTLFSLCVLIEQAFDSLLGTEDSLQIDWETSQYSFQDIANDTIREALIYQILLKSCAYLDEWHSVFGVKTEEGDKARIQIIKKIAKPANRCISTWKHLKDFRNEAIAHNHRDKNGSNIYLTRKVYNSPQSDGELYLLVFCVRKMTDVIYMFFEDSIKTFIENKGAKYKAGKFLSKKEIKKKVVEISDEIAVGVMRQKFLNSVVESVRVGQGEVTPVTVTFLELKDFRNS